jgi:hypothetical protein
MARFLTILHRWALAAFIACAPVLALAQPPKPAYVTGSPTTGAVAKSSGPQSFTTGDLSGDCATSGTLVVTCNHASTSTFGMAKCDGTTTTCSGGVISAVGGGGGSGAMTLIASATPSGTNVVTFTSIPSSYSTLMLVVNGRSTVVAGSDTPVMTFNSDTGANYIRTQIFANNGSVQWEFANSLTGLRAGQVPGANAAANYANTTVIYIAGYTSSFYKNILYNTGLIVGSVSSANMYVAQASQYWNSTSAITRIDLTLTGNWVSGSKISLYGLN